MLSRSFCRYGRAALYRRDEITDAPNNPFLETDGNIKAAALNEERTIM
ncbi:MAG: hypothetical protein ACLR56_11635 [Oscillospiraceae bacterium]